jgi:ADP-heptose:LPS heptosyltransferase
VLEEPSLPALAGALAQASAYVGNDSGVSHLAGMVGTPAVVLFVAANLRWRSWSASVRAVTVDATRVRPEDAAAVVDVLAGILGRGAVAPGARRSGS